jgi:D-alanyl-D-alanine carboxypeptidase/D-alanyl-D-alanine-endopeptidase (penicillin-binding protein 4)
MNWLVAVGTADEGYVFAAPYSTNGWLAGTIPANPDDFILKASIADPPRLMARVIDRRLRDAGIKISGEPSTTRLLQTQIGSQVHIINMIDSPPLRDIIKVINYESVNLYAEHLVKELGKKFLRQGTTEAGLKVIYEFLSGAGIDKAGFFLEDGSGVSPVNGINSMGVTELLCHMSSEAVHGNYFLSSLPAAGKEGTLARYFRDPEFETRMVAKSGSMTRVRSYAGYLKTLSGKNLAFCIIVNNFTGPAADVVKYIEAILRESITAN